MVLPIIGTLNRFFRAFSLPLRIASGTSFALPKPTPTCPSSSPTTTSAEKLNRRPPLTTLATRLMWMTRSLSLSSSKLSNAMLRLSELEAGLARCLGQRLDAPVVQVAVAVEHDLVDLSLEADLRDQRADLLGSLGLVTLAKGALQIGRQRGSSRQRASVHVVHDLCVDVARTAEHGQAR